MSEIPPHYCERMQSALTEVDVPVSYNDKYREYGIDVIDGGTSFIHMLFCPFCGARLPESLRDTWFERVWGLGLEPDDPRVPEEMRSGAWWRDPPQSAP